MQAEQLPKIRGSNEPIKIDIVIYDLILQGYY